MRRSICARQGRGQAVAGPLVESAQRHRRGAGPQRLGELIEPHHALAITGVLVEPGEDDQERTFHSRTPLTGDVATEESPTRSPSRWHSSRSSPTSLGPACSPA